MTDIKHVPPAAPLAGVQVVDMGQYIAGPGAAMALAELGASVVKIEPIAGDQARHIGRYGESMVRAYNRGKRSIALDLKSDAGREAAWRLISRADVVIQNLRPGVVDKLGLGPVAVRERFPRAIYLSISGFGRKGPSRDRPGYDIAAQAESGLMSLTGEPDRSPQKVGAPIVDAAAAQLGAQAVLAALYGRERTGVGATIDTSLLDVAMHLQAATWADFLGGGPEPMRMGDGQPHNAPAAEVVPTRDGHVVLSAYADDHWLRLCRVIGREALGRDPRFCSNEMRVANRDALREMLRESLSALSSEECVALLSGNQIVVGAVRSYSQVLNSAELSDGGLIVEAVGAGGLRYRALGLPYRINDTPSPSPHAAPACGADTDALLAEAGYSPKEMAAMHQAGVVASPAMDTTPAYESEARVHRALVQTLPLYEMMRMRAATTARRHPVLGYAGETGDSTLRWVNQFTHTHRKLGPDDREVVSPNNDTVYSNAWLDLSRGPVLIDTPDMGERYWTLGLLDAWTNPFAYIGRRTTGNHRQRTLVHGPDWRGTLPPGVSQVIAAPGDDVWLIGRVLVDDTAEDIEAVRALQASMRMIGLDGNDAAMRVDTLIDGRAVATPAVTDYVETVTQALRGNPPPDGESLDWPLDLDHVAAWLPRVFDELRQKDQPRALGGGWSLQLEVLTHWGPDVMTRARVARNFIGALGMQEAMYPTAEADGEGRALDGSHAYELRFPSGAGPRVGAFWSLTMYRRSDCLFVANPIHRYSIGDRTPGLRHDADGSLAIRIQARDPGCGHNWLPSPDGEPFYVVLRLYQPHAEHLEHRYTYPPLRRLD